uniref:WRC domain-containing protein n=2 Tax=Aegilops tauschii subsp. strangulata TaxID=200361 RepID=A0A452ZXA6_AEGTS
MESRRWPPYGLGSRRWRPAGRIEPAEKIHAPFQHSRQAAGGGETYLRSALLTNLHFRFFILQEVEHFMGKYFVSVPCRTSWLFQASILAASIKGEEQEEDMAGDMADEVFAKQRHKVAKMKRTVRENRGGEKNAWGLKKATEVQSDEDDFVAAGGGELWVCTKNDGKRRFCRRPVSQPDSFCVYHSDPKSALPPASSAASKPSISAKPRKRRRVDAGEGYLYYAGFGPSLSKRQRSSSNVLESLPAEQEEEALPEEHTAGPAQTVDADHQAASAHVDEPRCDEMAGIAGGDEESSDDALGCNDEPRVVGVNGNIKRKSPFKKRWRKPVKARSLKSLMC